MCESNIAKLMTGDNQMEEEKHIYSRVIGARNNK